MALMYKMVLLINGKEKVICNTTEEKFNRNLEVAKARGYQVLNKTKLYPVGNWYKYQHVLYNAYDRAMNAMYDAEQSGTAEQLDKAIEWNERVEDLLSKFDCGFQDANGMVYMEYKDYKETKDIIGEYAYRHNGTV